MRVTTGCVLINHITSIPGTLSSSKLCSHAHLKQQVKSQPLDKYVCIQYAYIYGLAQTGCFQALCTRGGALPPSPGLVAPPSLVVAAQSYSPVCF